MKNNKGITLISLIITIIVIIIIAAITLYYGLTQNMEQAKETKSAYEVHEIIDAVVNRSLMNDLNSNYYALIGKTEYTPITITDKDGNTEEYTSEKGWYLVSEEEEFRALGLNGLKDQYLVNYDMGGVVSVDGIKYQGATYHSLNDLKDEMGGGTTILSKAEYDSNKGVNKPVLSQGMIPVKYSNGDWIVTGSDDAEWYDYSKDQMAWANVMLMDELEVEGIADVQQSSLAELAGKKVTSEGSAYVWIPRYTATNVGGIDSKIIFSNLLKDTTNEGGETYTCPSAFTFGDGADTIELTGIWVSKYEAGFAE